MDALAKIQKAKSQLIIDQPFFATLLLSTPMLEDNSVPTMATDGETILYNKKFTDSLTLQETIFVLAHEAMHIVFDHMSRRGSRTPNRYNQAADYIINEILVNDKVGVMPTIGLYNPQLTKRGGNTTEGVYNLLPESSEKKSAGQKGGALDSVNDSGSDNGTKKVDASTIAEKSAANKIKVIQAKNIAKAQGKLSANIERLVDNLTESKIDWKEVLRNFVSEKVKLEASWSKPKRRFLGDDLYLPSLSGEKLGKIVIAIDCSGSVDSELLNLMASEVQGIRDSVYPSKIDLIYFDSDICGDIKTIEENEELKLEARGGGGTDFAPIFKAINSLESAPLCCLVLTDLICDSFGEPPSYPVLWCILDKAVKGYDSTPFGEILEVTSHEN